MNLKKLKNIFNYLMYKSFKLQYVRILMNEPFNIVAPEEFIKSIKYYKSEFYDFIRNKSRGNN